MSLLGAQGDLKWRQEPSGTVTIDLSQVPYRELDALENAWVIKVEGVK